MAYLGAALNIQWLHYESSKLPRLRGGSAAGVEAW